MTASLPGNCTCFQLRRAARRVSQVYDRELAAVGISLNEYSILRHAQPEAAPLSALADSLGMERTTLTRNLKPLLQAGWLREARGQDVRQRLISLTPEGAAQLQRARPCWHRAQEKIDRGFGNEANAQLRVDLDQLDIAMRGILGSKA